MIYATILVLLVFVDDPILRHFVKQSSRGKVKKPHLFISNRSGVIQWLKWLRGSFTPLDRARVKWTADI